MRYCTFEKPRIFEGTILNAQVLVFRSRGTSPTPKIILLSSSWFFLKFFFFRSSIFSFSSSDRSCYDNLKMEARSAIDFEYLMNVSFSSGSKNYLNLFSICRMPLNNRMKYVLKSSSSMISPRIVLDIRV